MLQSVGLQSVRHDLMTEQVLVICPNARNTRIPQKGPSCSLDPPRPLSPRLLTCSGLRDAACKERMAVTLWVCSPSPTKPA